MCGPWEVVVAEGSAGRQGEVCSAGWGKGRLRSIVGRLGAVHTVGSSLRPSVVVHFCGRFLLSSVVSVATASFSAIASVFMSVLSSCLCFSSACFLILCITSSAGCSLSLIASSALLGDTARCLFGISTSLESCGCLSTRPR